MTKPKFKAGDRIQYVGGVEPRKGKVLMLNGAASMYTTQYDIQIEGRPDVYTVAEGSLKHLMSDPSVAKGIVTDLLTAQKSIQQARDALKRAKDGLVHDGQPDYETGMLDEFDIVLKNTLRLELTTEANRWHDIYVERKKDKS